LTVRRRNRYDSSSIAGGNGAPSGRSPGSGAGDLVSRCKSCCRPAQGCHNARQPGAARAWCSRQVELAVLDAEGERFPFLGRGRAHRTVRRLGIARGVELLGVCLVRPAGGVCGDRDFHAVARGSAVAGPAPGRSICQHGTRLLVTVRVTLASGRPPGQEPGRARVGRPQPRTTGRWLSSRARRCSSSSGLSPADSQASMATNTTGTKQPAETAQTSATVICWSAPALSAPPGPSYAWNTAAASQGLSRGTAGGAACCCLMGLSRTAAPGGAASGGRARRWPPRRLALAMIVAIITLFAGERHNHQQNERATPPLTAVAEPCGPRPARPH